MRIVTCSTKAVTREKFLGNSRRLLSVVPTLGVSRVLHRGYRRKGVPSVMVSRDWATAWKAATRAPAFLSLRASPAYCSHASFRAPACTRSVFHLYRSRHSLSLYRLRHSLLLYRLPHFLLWYRLRHSLLMYRLRHSLSVAFKTTRRTG